VTAPPIVLTHQVALEAMDIAASNWSWSRDDCLTELQGFVRGRGVNAYADDWPGELEAVVEAASGPLPALKQVLDSCRVFGRGYCGLGDLNIVGRKRI